MKEQEEEQQIEVFHWNQWKDHPMTKKFFQKLREEQEKATSEAETLSDASAEDWRIRVKNIKSKTIREIVKRYA